MHGTKEILVVCNQHDICGFNHSSDVHQYRCRLKNAALLKEPNNI